MANYYLQKLPEGMKEGENIVYPRMQTYTLHDFDTVLNHMHTYVANISEGTMRAVLEALAELVYGRITKSVSAKGSKGGVLEDLAAGQASQYDLLAAGNGKMKALGKRAKKPGYKVKAPKKVK